VEDTLGRKSEIKRAGRKAKGESRKNGKECEPVPDYAQKEVEYTLGRERM